jgi:hypothetical protein
MRKVPAVLIVVFLVFPVLLAALLTISVSTWALDRQFYAGLLSDERLYEIPAFVDGEQWSGGTGFAGFSLFRNPAAMREIATRPYMRSQALAIMNEGFDFLDGRSPIFDPAINLAPLKKALATEAGKRFALATARGLPVCASSEGFSLKDGTIPRCRPSSISVEKAAALITAALPSLTARIPDALRLSELPEARYIPPRWWSQSGFSALGALVLADVVLLTLACGFLVAGAFVGGATLRERLLWLGWPLFAPSVLVFLCGIGALVPLAGGWVWDGIRSVNLGSVGFSPGFSAAFFETARHAVWRVAAAFLATGGIALGISIGLVVWAMTLGNDPKNEARTEGA